MFQHHTPNHMPAMCANHDNLWLKPVLQLAPLLLALATARADETPPGEALRQGLYAEEVKRDPEAAARHYEDILVQYARQQVIAATALFRLAEVRNSQGRKDEAIKLYQQLLTDFPKAEAEAELARQQLATLGGKIPEAGLAVVDEEEREIARFDQLLATAPDMARKSGLLGGAATKGQLRVVRHLLKAGMDADEVQNTLDHAAGQGYLAVVKAILELGKLPKSRLSPALGEAVRSGNTEVVRALLNAGAGTDRQWHYRGSGFEDEAWSTGGTPLNAALLRGDSAVVDLLLAAKADPNLASEETGIMPLHAAVMSGVMPLADRTADVGKLLDHGADPEAYTKEPDLKNAPAILAGPVSPLEVALLYHADPNWASAKLLLQRGANPKQPVLFERLFALLPDGKALSKIRFLLENGADPNARDPGDDPILLQVVKRGDPEVLKLFLKHGADAKVKLAGWKMLREPGHGDPFAATTGKWEEVPGSLLGCVKSEDPKVALEITRLLLDAGAKADGLLGAVLSHVAKLDEDGALVRKLLDQRPATVNLAELPHDLRQWKPVPRRLFLDTVVIPALAKDGSIQLLHSETGKWQPLATPAAEPPSATPALLLANADALLPKYDETRPGINKTRTYVANYYWPVLSLVRPAADGGFERQDLDLTGDQPLPALQPGDVLELARSGEPALSSGDGIRSSSAIDALKTTLIWHLRKRIAFPVTIALDGQTREFKLRGDLLTFDPTKNEAPLLTAGSLANLLLPDLSAADDASSLKEDTILTVRRRGAADLRMDLSAPAAYRFELQAGDHLVLPDANSVMRQAANPGREPIWLVTPGFPYRRCYRTEESEPLLPPKLSNRPPTLLQLLTDAYFPHGASSPFLEMELDEAAYPTLMGRIQRNRAPTVPPHPDFANLRIRRTGADGKEVVLEVNLTDAIRRCTAATPTAEARQADIELQPGDVVELPLKTDQLVQPWGGFSAEEENFFRKALGGFFTLRTGDGIIEQREILYHQPEWRQTPHGLMALRPRQGVASTRATHIGQVGSRSRVVRGNDPLQVNRAFVRDGDQLLETTTHRVTPPPGPTGESRKPFVPTPPASR